MKKTAGIYIHIPFCTVKCMYCDFYSITDRIEDTPQFIDAIIKEIKLSKDLYIEKFEFDTVFFGGGTPSLIDPKWIEKILITLNETFNFKKKIEISIEVNPGEISLKKLITLKKIGLNRISIGVQSLDKNLLKFLDRLHSPQDSIVTYKNARKAGFDNINTDLIYNIPNQSIFKWQKDIQTMIELNVDHISSYSLTVEKGTILNKEVNRGNIIMPNDKNDMQMYLYAVDELTHNQYEQYEISNFAKKNKKCLHNLHYWNLDPYISFGPSAHSYDTKKRWWNTKSLDKYLQMISNGKLPLQNFENLNRNDDFNELLLNGLRMSDGIKISRLEGMYPLDDFHKYLNEKLKKNSRLKVKNSYLKLSEQGKLFADEIASNMFI
tara:strand:+ start:1750 stop:2886 length:1137 start_codon:yes stop_codon:yes gene_type:complete